MKSIVIIGGGATAVCAFRAVTEAEDIAAVRFVAPGPIGIAGAFGSGDLRALCNTSVDVTSLSPDGESGLLSYLAARGWPVHRDDFVPRFLVTQYLRESFQRLRDDCVRRGTRVAHVRGRALRVTGLPGDYRVHLADGRVLPATDVLVCVNGTSTAHPEYLVGHHPADRLFTTPYPLGALRRIPAGARVLVAGTKLSAIDAALVLCRRGVHTVMTSPSGELPAVRTRLRRHRGTGLAAEFRSLLAAGAGPQELLRPVARRIRRRPGGDR
ncbi:FAD/NAD(P)-binding protein, partial [Streptomyces sp. NPDC000151]|uniref:FAD/NAD(P)-binding protein n=1 Tax=Streptomyces sp. NPDC000151 TaxID=3154244 RepID=UPI0033169DBC